jgi:hypothetical protein
MRYLTRALFVLFIIGVTVGLTYFFGQQSFARGSEHNYFIGFCSTLYVYVAIGITYLAVVKGMG